MQPDETSKELTVTSLHPAVTRDRVQDNCGWKLKWAADVATTPVPTELELATLRDIHARTKKAHGVAG